MNFHIDFEGSWESQHVQKAFKELEAISKDIAVLGSAEVPWFPTNITDFDYIGKRILSEGDGIQEADHPGFHDAEYRKRRDEITNVAFEYKVGEPIPRLTYTK